MIDNQVTDMHINPRIVLKKTEIVLDFTVRFGVFKALTTVAHDGVA